MKEYAYPPYHVKGVITYIPWIRVTPWVVSDKTDRSPARYAAVVAQFAVETNPRYAPRDGKTYCNIFAWDVTRAMGSEIPHWADSAGRPAAPMTFGAHRLNCTAMWRWLHEHGVEHEWREVTAVAARRAANRGEPAIAIWPNAAGNGHVVMVVPQMPGDDEPMCAQAGQTRFTRGTVAAAFGSNRPEFWVHP